MILTKTAMMMIIFNDFNLAVIINFITESSPLSVGWLGFLVLESY